MIQTLPKRKPGVQSEIHTAALAKFHHGGVQKHYF